MLMDEQGGAIELAEVVLVADARTQWAEIDRRIAAFDVGFVRWVRRTKRLAG